MPNPQQPVLVVEDDGDARNLLKLFVELHGYEVQLASDGVEALSAVTIARPGLILLDLRMPRMDGAAFGHALRGSGDPELAKTPIVLMSAFPTADAAREINAVEVLPKPIDLFDLSSALLRHCPARPPLRASR